MRSCHPITALVLGLAALVGSASGATAADRAWVEMAPGGGSLVRVLTAAQSCPSVVVDGRSQPMAIRVAPAQLAPRPNKAQVADGAVFTRSVCELPLSRHVRRATLAGAVLPLPRARIDRIVLIGDTGCRLKGADKAWQACNDPARWPFAVIAARAAALHPDLVLHVGDYLYRENPCPNGEAGCAGTVWGYGEAGWKADFLDPAAPLLAAAPWAMVRGNHEECARAGQGWWRLLDPHPLLPASDCDEAANDLAGNHTDPYAVDLGGGARLIVADLDELANGKADDPALVAAVQADAARIDTLARGARNSFLTAHYPLNAVLWDKDGSGAVVVGIKGITVAAPLAPGHIRAMLSGHIHMFQYARFADRPTQVITGFSGTMEDAALAPGNLAEAQGRAGASIIRALSTIPGRFGYGLMERRRRGWRLTAYAVDGTIMGRYSL